MCDAILTDLFRLYITWAIFRTQIDLFNSTLTDMHGGRKILNKDNESQL